MNVPCVDFIARKVIKPLHETLVLDRHLRVLSEHISQLISPQGRVKGLDVGCGSGKLARRMMDAFPNLEIVGADVVVRRDAFIPVIPYEGKRLPCADRSFDFTMLVDVLHHADNPAGVLRECRRASRRFVLIKDHICESRWDGMRLRMMDWGGNRAEGINMPYGYLSRSDWERLFKEVGLVPDYSRYSLGLFPPPFSFIFEGSLHFIARLSLSGARG